MTTTKDDFDGRFLHVTVFIESTFWFLLQVRFEDCSGANSNLRLIGLLRKTVNALLDDLTATHYGLLVWDCLGCKREIE
jgi:hypothetical protein